MLGWSCRGTSPADKVQFAVSLTYLHEQHHNKNTKTPSKLVNVIHSPASERAARAEGAGVGAWGGERGEEDSFAQAERVTNDSAHLLCYRVVRQQYRTPLFFVSNMNDSSQKTADPRIDLFSRGRYGMSARPRSIGNSSMG